MSNGNMNTGNGGINDGPANQDNNHGDAGPFIDRNSMFSVRDQLFHALFLKAALAYARAVPIAVRRLIEFLVLLKALTAFFVLVYIHLVFTRSPTTCLEHIKNDWPRDGILRVEILQNQDNYGIEQSYAKEKQIKETHGNDFSSIFGLITPDITIHPSDIDHTEEHLDHINDDQHNGTNQTVFIDDDIAFESTAWNPSTERPPVKFTKYNQLDELMNLVGTKNVTKNSINDMKSSKSDAQQKPEKNLRMGNYLINYFVNTTFNLFCLF